MKKLKKLFIGFIALFVAVSISGCGKKINRSAEDGNEQKLEKAAIQLVKATEDGKYKLINAEELKKDVDSNADMVLVNTIPADRFAETKIKGAVNADLPKKMDELKPEQKEKFLKALGTDKNKKIVVYCGYVACERSHVGAKLAVEAGYKNVYRFPGGIASWLDAGNSIDK